MSLCAAPPISVIFDGMLEHHAMQLEEAGQRAQAAESNESQLVSESESLRSELAASQQLLREHQDRLQNDQAVMVSDGPFS